MFYGEDSSKVVATRQWPMSDILYMFWNNDKAACLVALTVCKSQVGLLNPGGHLTKVSAKTQDAE